MKNPSEPHTQEKQRQKVHHLQGGPSDTASFLSALATFSSIEFDQWSKNNDTKQGVFVFQLATGEIIICRSGFYHCRISRNKHIIFL